MGTSWHHLGSTAYAAAASSAPVQPSLQATSKLARRRLHQRGLARRDEALALSVLNHAAPYAVLDTAARLLRLQLDRDARACAGTNSFEIHHGRVAWWACGAGRMVWVAQGERRRRGHGARPLGGTPAQQREGAAARPMTPPPPPPPCPRPYTPPDRSGRPRSPMSSVTLLAILGVARGGASVNASPWAAVRRVQGRAAQRAAGDAGLARACVPVAGGACRPRPSWSGPAALPKNHP